MLYISVYIHGPCSMHVTCRTLSLHATCCMSQHQCQHAGYMQSYQKQTCMLFVVAMVTTISTLLCIALLTALGTPTACSRTVIHTQQLSLTKPFLTIVFALYNLTTKCRGFYMQHARYMHAIRTCM